MTESPTSVLMHAARKMREDAAICGDPPGSFIPEVASLLEAFTSCECDEDGDHWREKSAALRIARAYVGEPGTEGAERG